MSVYECLNLKILFILYVVKISLTVIVLKSSDIHLYHFKFYFAFSAF